jgi:hypothetical protein
VSIGSATVSSNCREHGPRHSPGGETPARQLPDDDRRRRIAPCRSLRRHTFPEIRERLWQCCRIGLLGRRECSSLLMFKLEGFWAGPFVWSNRAGVGRPATSPAVRRVSNKPRHEAGGFHESLRGPRSDLPEERAPLRVCLAGRAPERSTVVAAGVAEARSAWSSARAPAARAPRPRGRSDLPAAHLRGVSTSWVLATGGYLCRASYPVKTAWLSGKPGYPGVSSGARGGAWAGALRIA